MTTVVGTAKPKVTIRRVSVRAHLERYAYLSMRITGVALLVLAVGHMLIQHVLNSSGNLTLIFVAEQWKDWGWKVYDMLLLVFAIVHGFNGLRNVLEDYIHSRSTIRVVNIFLIIFCILTIIWAGFAIASFDPDTALEAAKSLP